MQKKKKNPNNADGGILHLAWAETAFNIWKWKKRQEAGAEAGKGCAEYWMLLKKIFEQGDSMIRSVLNLC